MVAVHRRREQPDHPGQGLDRHLDTGTEATGLGQENLANGHGPRLTPGPVDSVDYTVDAPRTSCCRRARKPGRHRRGARWATSSSTSTARSCGTSSATRCRSTSPRWRSRCAGTARDPGRDRKAAGRAARRRADSAVFDRVRTCDNHCPFCFIYQLPKGMRRSLYLKDDDYRLSHLYGNFTTLTRFTEADLERVITEGLGPLYVSIHATDPDVRTAAAAQPAGRNEPALARVAARRRGRGPRPDRRVSRRERRRRARRHAARHPRPLPGARDGRRGAARRVGPLERARDARRTPAPRRRRCSTRSTRGRRGTSTRSAAGWSSPPTSTTS